MWRANKKGIRVRLLSPHPVPDAGIGARIFSPLDTWSQVSLIPGAAGTDPPRDVATLGWCDRLSARGGVRAGLAGGRWSRERRFPACYRLDRDVLRRVVRFHFLHHLDLVDVPLLRVGCGGQDDVDPVVTLGWPDPKRPAVTVVDEVRSRSQLARRPGPSPLAPWSHPPQRQLDPVTRTAERDGRVWPVGGHLAGRTAP